MALHLQCIGVWRFNMITEKKIFVIDKTGVNAPPPLPMPVMPVIEVKPVEPEPVEPKTVPKPIPKKIPSRLKNGRHTYASFIMEKMLAGGNGDALSNEELALAWYREIEGQKLYAAPQKMRNSFSITISQLRAQGYPITQIKRGRYGIRREDARAMVQQ